MSAPTLRLHAAVAMLVGCALAADPALAATRTVVIDGFAFASPEVHLKAGDTVEWVNRDVVEHTASASDGAFDSKAIRQGGTWRWTARKVGRHPYVCAYHPTMTGLVVVE